MKTQSRKTRLQVPRFFLNVLNLLLVTSGHGLAETDRLPLSMLHEVEGVRYSEEIPRPESVIGHEIGTRHTLPHLIVDYFQAVDQASDRVQLGKHGETYENRPLIHAIVSSPQNLSRLEEIRLNNLKLSEEPQAVGDAELRDLPAIVLMGYSVHGNEASGSEAAMLLLYHLAAGSGAAVDPVLENTVVLIDPMLNPDGRNRFVNWVNINRGRVPTQDPADREHNEAWPGGRTNHYWFDLNRDWLPAQLKESQARLELYHQWRPQLVTDFHEMGSNSTFFFQPGVETRENPNTPARTRELTKEVARFHARAFDKAGALYYSEEQYDDFYYGKGSTYPDINGGVGILFEQASSRSLQRETSSGILHFGFTVRNQILASLSTLEAGLAMRLDLIRNQRDFYSEARDLVRQSPVKGYVISGKDRGSLDLVEIMLRHQIRVFVLQRSMEVDGGSYTAGEDFVVPFEQRQARLLKVLMERVTEFGDSIFYDVSTWTLPLALGVETAPLTDLPGGLIGEEITALPEQQGFLRGGTATYAYLMEWTSKLAPRALHRLQAAQINTRVLTKPVTLNLAGQETTFSRPTIIIPVVQPRVPAERVHGLIEQVVNEDNARIHALASGLTKEGPDLGGPSSRPLELPLVAVFSGQDTRSSQVGETWFLLNERLGIPVSLIDVEDIARTSLAKYNVITLAGGTYTNIDEATIEKLKGWVKGGGLLIAFRRGARWLIEKELVAEKIREVEEQNLEVPFEEVRDARRSEAIQGSIFSARLDNTHPIGYGFRSTISFFRDHDIFIEPSLEAGANVAIYTDDPLRSGYIPEDKLEVLKGTAAIVARKVGSGAVVLFADNPNFRAFWHGSSGLFVNAVFFGRAF
jgi:hypothetical protein